MASYGIPYMGSKDAIIHKIAPLFSKADNFYDLFGGGFAVSHFMALHHSDKYKRIVYNEVKEDVVQLVRDAIDGKYNYDRFKPKWISREDFARDKDRCAYTRLIWSFGNNQKGYLFGEENELNKKSLHNAVVFNEFDAVAKGILQRASFPRHLSIRGRRLLCRKIVSERRGELQQLEQLERLQRLEQLEQLERLQRLEQLERLQRLEQLQQLEQLERLQRLQRLEQLQQLEQLERLERLERLELSSLSYEKVEILPSSVVYCDPPYKGTAGYVTTFDHDRFWGWVRSQPHPVFVSEYTAPKDIAVIMALNHKKRLSAEGSVTDSVEKVFGNAAAVQAVRGNYA